MLLNTMIVNWSVRVKEPHEVNHDQDNDSKKEQNKLFPAKPCLISIYRGLIDLIAQNSLSCFRTTFAEPHSLSPSLELCKGLTSASEPHPSLVRRPIKETVEDQKQSSLPGSFCRGRHQTSSRRNNRGD